MAWKYRPEHYPTDGVNNVRYKRSPGRAKAAVHVDKRGLTLAQGQVSPGVHASTEFSLVFQSHQRCFALSSCGSCFVNLIVRPTLTSCETGYLI
jgi:hypothetical protein